MDDFKAYAGKDMLTFTKATPDSLTLRRASNGGWMVVGNASDAGLIPVLDAAYSNTEEMIAGLTGMLKD